MFEIIKLILVLDEDDANTKSMFLYDDLKFLNDDFNY